MDARDESFGESEEDKESEEDTWIEEMKESEEENEHKESEEKCECGNEDLLCRLFDGQCLIAMHWKCWIMNWS